MSIELGHAYQFSFTAGFETLNGIYRVTHALSYDSLLEGSVDLLASLYTPAGKDQDDLDADLDALSAESYYKLVHVTSALELYMPKGYIVGIPVPDVREYVKLMLSIDLGVMADPAILQSIVDTVKDVIQGAHGVTNDPVLLQYSTQWMSETTYEAIVAAREQARTGVTNYYTLSQQQAATIVEKNARIAALEILVDQLRALIP
jgi:hypothetical protein